MISEPGSEGQVYGNIGTWKGVGLFLDSFDNDGLVSQNKNSYFYLCVLVVRGN